MNKLSFYGLFLVPILYFLPFDQYEYYVQFLAQIILACSVLVVGLFVWRKRGRFFVPPGSIFLGLLLCCILLQIVPLPLSLLQEVLPFNYGVYSPILAVTDDVKYVMPSVCPKASLDLITHIIGMLLFYIATTQLFTNGSLLRKYVWRLVVISALIAVSAWFRLLLISFDVLPAWDMHEEILSLQFWKDQNPNIGFGFLTIPLTLALFVYYHPGVSKMKRPGDPFSGWWQFPGAGRQLFLLITLITLGGVEYLYIGRAGAALIALTLTIFTGVLLFNRITMKRFMATVIATGSLVLVCFTEFLQLKSFLLRINGEDISFSWEPVYSGMNKVWQLMQEFLFVGSGAGTYENISSSLYHGGEMLISNGFAPQSFVKFSVEVGFLGICCGIIFIIVVLGKGALKLQKRKDTFSVLLGAATITGLLLMLVLALLGLDIYSVSYGFVFLLYSSLLIAAGYSQSFLNFHDTSLPRGQMFWKPFLTLSGAILFLVVMFLRGGEMRGIAEHSAVSGLPLHSNMLKKDLVFVSEKYENALRYDPFEARYFHDMGIVLDIYNLPHESLEYYMQASLKNPLRGEYLQDLAMRLPEEQSDTAFSLMGAGYERMSDKSKITLQYAEWLIFNGRKDESLKVFKKGLLENNSLLNGTAKLLSEHQFSREEVVQVLPKSVESWISYGEYLIANGDKKGAEYYIENALMYLPSEKVIQARWFHIVFKAYTLKSDLQKAKETVELGLKYLPESEELKELLANLPAISKENS
jgi:hypothetical protein